MEAEPVAADLSNEAQELSAFAAAGPGDASRCEPALPPLEEAALVLQLDLDSAEFLEDPQAAAAAPTTSETISLRGRQAPREEARQRGCPPLRQQHSQRADGSQEAEASALADGELHRRAAEDGVDDICCTMTPQELEAFATGGRQKAAAEKRRARSAERARPPPQERDHFRTASMPVPRKAAKQTTSRPRFGDAELLRKLPPKAASQAALSQESSQLSPSGGCEVADGAASAPCDSRLDLGHIRVQVDSEGEAARRESGQSSQSTSRPRRKPKKRDSLKDQRSSGSS